MALPGDDEEELGLGGYASVAEDGVGVPGGAPPIMADPNPEDGSQIEMLDDGGDGDLLSAIDEVLAPGETAEQVGDQASQDMQDPFDSLRVKDGESVGTGASVGRSGSSTGITEHGKKQAAGYFDKARADAAAESDLYAGDMAAAQAKFEEAWAKRHESLAEAERATKEHHDNLTGIANDRFRFLQEQADMEQKATLVAQAEAQKYMAGYENDMVAVRQLAAQSGNPLGGLDGTQKLALGAAAFAQGFLGARYGINVNVTGQVDNWVKQEMEHHQKSIANAKDIAQSNLTLYGLARQGAKDDWEARERLRGFVIDGLKTKVVMEANRFKSDMAKSDAMEKVAALDILQAQTKMGIRDKIAKETRDNLQLHLNAANQEAGRAIESRSQQASASYQARMAKVAEREQTMKEKKQDADQNTDVTWTPISDPSTPEVGQDGAETNSGLNRWMPDENADKENRTKAVAKAAELKAAYAEGREAMDQLIRLRKAAEKSMGLPAVYRERDEDYKRYQSEKDNLIGKVQRAMTGLSFTEGETKKWEGQLQDEKILGQDTKKLMYDFSDRALREYNARMSSLEGAGIRKIRHDELQKYGKYTQYETLDPATRARNKVNLTDDPAVATPQGKEVAKVRGPQDERGWLGRITDEVTNNDIKEHPTYQPKASGAWKAVMGDSPQPYESEAVDKLARAVMDPDSFRSQHRGEDGVPEDRNALRAELRKSLKTIATGERVKPEVQRYAATVSGLLNEVYNEKSSRADREAAAREVWNILKE